MNIGLYQSVSGMKSMWEDQQIIAANLARSSTPGHKASFGAFYAEAQKSQKPGESTIPNAVTMIKPYINYSQGLLEPTGNIYDVAVRGDAYFSVQEKDGSVAYTRNGQFTRDAAGVLRSSDGMPVLSSTGAQIVIPSATSVLVSSDGTITADGNDVARLGLSTFGNASEDLTPNVNGRFSLNDSKAAKAAAATDTVEQGYLEKGNSDTVHEMVRMMEVMRVYQANQQMIAAQDGVTGKLIQTVSSK